MREAKINRDLSRLFFRKAIRINSGERLDQRALTVIDVTGGRENEVWLGHSRNTGILPVLSDCQFAVAIENPMGRPIRQDA